MSVVKLHVWMTRALVVRRCLPAALALALVALPALSGCGKDEPDAAQANKSSPGSGQKGARGKAPGGKWAGGGKGMAADKPAVPVAVESAVRGSIANYYSATATLEPYQEAEVLARGSGVIQSIRAEEGDVVKKGAELLRIENGEQRFRLKQAEAEEAKQRMRFERFEQMVAGDLVSKEEYETAQNDLKAAEAALSLAQLDLSYTRVTAPFAGSIVRRQVDTGQNVNNGTALFSLADLGRLVARVHVPAKEFRTIQTDQPVELKLDSTTDVLNGMITLVSPVIDPQSGTIKVTVEVSDYPPTTRSGDFAEVRVVTALHPNAILVPKNAVITDKGDLIVYVAADSLAERRVVETGFQDENYAEIMSGVTEGEVVVVQGQRSLKHGTPLKIMERFAFDEEPRAEADTSAES